ncbi:MAG: PhzF family phenazine biosynthesis isomerase [Fodinibius sp.]|nr:PhzF family phenazine biosynthesis isomerase [Fodinibius sp.]
MKRTLYQVDAFANEIFEGNPAAVCPLESWLEDEMLQNIAEENNLSETAYFVRTDNSYRLRWFTPTTEVDLCGHATLASAHVLFEELGYPEDTIRFDSNSGELSRREAWRSLGDGFSCQYAQRIGRARFFGGGGGSTAPRALP